VHKKENSEGRKKKFKKAGKWRILKKMPKPILISY